MKTATAKTVTMAAKCTNMVTFKITPRTSPIAPQSINEPGNQMRVTLRIGTPIAADVKRCKTLSDVGRMPKDEVRSTVLCVRIRPSLKKRLERLADRDRRTLSNWIELLLERTAKDGEKEKHSDLH